MKIENKEELIRIARTLEEDENTKLFQKVCEGEENFRLLSEIIKELEKTEKKRILKND